MKKTLIRNRPRVVIDVSNLSIHNKKFIRTGIQEVIYKTLLSLVKLRGKFEEIELILLPQLPRRFGDFLSGTTTVPYQNPARFILESIEADLKLPSEDVWGIDLKKFNYHLSDESVLEWIVGAQSLHIQGMVNIAPLVQHLIQVGSPCSKNLSMTVYDLSPVLFPEFCDHGLARWFQGTYLPALGQYLNHAICISKHTAMDVRENSITQKIPKVTVLPLPFELGRASLGSSDEVRPVGIGSQPYLIFLGSLEPRKNFESLLVGFESYIQIYPDSALQLVWVGSTGWKNERLEKRIKDSSVASRVIRAGYLSDDTLGRLIEGASAMMMLSFYEGFGLPVAQAYSRGVPIVTTLGSSLPEACAGEAIFVEPSDPYSVSAGIVRALQMGSKKDRRYQLRNWTWDHYAEELLKLTLNSQTELR